MKLETLLSKLKKDERYHLSRLKVKEIYSVEKQIKNKANPHGFWYAFSSDWLKYINIPEKQRHIVGLQPLCCYLYKININIDNCSNKLSDKNKNKVLVIDNIRNLNRFIKKYKLEMYIPIQHYLFGIININWIQVSKDFDGIEFNPYLKKELDNLIRTKYDKLEKEKKSTINILNKLISKYYWYFTLKIPSGCIWNKTQIKTFKLIAKQDKKTKQWKWIQ